MIRSRNTQERDAFDSSENSIWKTKFYFIRRKVAKFANGTRCFYEAKLKWFKNKLEVSNKKFIASCNLKTKSDDGVVKRRMNKRPFKRFLKNHGEILQENKLSQFVFLLSFKIFYNFFSLSTSSHLMQTLFLVVNRLHLGHKTSSDVLKEIFKSDSLEIR